MTGERAPQPRERLKFLLDTNIVVAVEPFDGSIEASMPLAARLLRLANEQGHVLCVAPATRDDILESSDPRRRAQRLAELQKFSLLAEVPLTDILVAKAGASKVGSNDHRDLRLLATLDAGAVTYLVTDDGRFRKRSVRAGLGEATLSLAEAVDLLSSFAPQFAPPPPRVVEIPAYALDTGQSIFESLRIDYEGFEDWLRRLRADSDRRIAFVILEGQEYAGIALLKLETECEYDFSQPVLKISTFKVSDLYSGVKYGELLLKAIFSRACALEIATIYVETFERHETLLTFLQDFGFEDSGDRTERGELVMRKSRIPQAGADLDDLSYHIRFGPPAARLRQQLFVIPIEPRWHDQLFPELIKPPVASQPTLFDLEESNPLTHPWGNALRKAYLCNSNVNTIHPGDAVMFYRSHDWKAVTVLGLVEGTLRSGSPAEVTTFVGRRTVYTPDEIAHMTRSVRGVLAIRFRQDRLIEPRWLLEELVEQQVLRSHPQSVSRVPERGVSWVRSRLNE